VAEAVHLRGQLSPERLVTFCDAVFAIAMTLLALELRLPEGALHGGDLAAALIATWPKVLSFAISFAAIAQFWRGHLRAFTWIDRVDGRLVTLNLLLLMVVCFLPFPTAVLGDAGDETPAVVLYAGSVATASLLQALMWLYASAGGRLLRADTPQDVRRHGVWRSLVPFVVFAASIGIAWCGYPGAAMYSWLAIIPLYRVLSIVRSRIG
jgi:uncharacterized membrane protein